MCLLVVHVNLNDDGDDREKACRESMVIVLMCD